MPSRKLLSIDPSLRSLGYCIHDMEGSVLAAGVIKQESSNDIAYQIRAIMMARAVDNLISLPGDEEYDVIIESPENWFGERGMQSKDNEAVQKLYYLVGMLVGKLDSNQQVNGVYVVTPTQWKGSAPKDVMMERAVKYCASQMIMLPLKMPHDTAEAILLGRFAIRHRKAPTNDYTNDYYAPPIIALPHPFSSSSIVHESFVDAPDSPL